MRKNIKTVKSIGNTQNENFTTISVEIKFNNPLKNYNFGNSKYNWKKL